MILESFDFGMPRVNISGKKACYIKGLDTLVILKKLIFFILHFLKAAIEEEGSLYGPGIDDSM